MIIYIYTHTYILSFNLCTSLVAQIVKNLPAMRETRVWSLGQEDPLEIFPTPVDLPPLQYSFRRISWTKNPGRLQPHGVTDSDRLWHNWATNIFTFTLGPLHSFPHPQPLTPTTTNLFSIPVCSIYLESTCKHSHTVFIFICLNYFA